MNLAQISSSLIFITTIAALIIEAQQLSISSITNDNRLPLNVVPMHYDIQLNLILVKFDSNITQPSYIKQKYGSFLLHGECTITIQIHNSTQSIKFHTSPNLIINQGNIKLTDNNDRIYIIKESEYNSKTERFDIQFFSILSRGNYTLKVEFYGQITDNNAKNFVSSSYINKEENLILLIAPHIQEVGARRLFPCWDEPHFKTTINISVKHHYKFRALSNMPKRDYYWDDDGAITHFHTTPPMSTYQVSVILINFRFTRIYKYRYKNYIWYAKRSRQQSLEYVERVIKKTTLDLKSEFNDTKILEIHHIVIPNLLPNNGMSKWGFVFHREADLICNDTLDPIMRKIEIARSVASKIAYQWLGNIVTRSWWSQFWLHESFAMLYGEDAVAKTVNDSQIMDFFTVQSQYDSLHLDPHFDMNPPKINNLSQVDLISSFPRNIKGIVVLRMLQDIITDKPFRDGIHTFLHKHKYRSLTFNEFRSIQEEITSHSYENYLSLNFFNWIIYEHYPVISLTQKDPGVDYVQLSQYFNASQNSYGKWWIPIRLMTKFSLKRPNNVWLTPEKPSLSVVHTAKDDWIMVDIRQAGYYRIKYDMENLRKIALYLNSEAYKNISVINRAKIIDDAFYFLLARESNATVFWELAKYLTQETNYAAWYPMLKVFEYISSVFPLINGKINFMHVKETMREILTKPLKVLGFKKHPREKNLIECLRQEIIKWACMIELSECQMNNKLSEQIVKNPALVLKILPEWKSFMYCKGIKLMSFKDMGLEEHMEYTTNCLKDDKLLYPVFHYFWPKISQLGRQHGVQEKDIRMRIATFHHFIATHAKNDTMLKKILSFFHHIKPPEISTAAALINIINHIYSTATLNNVLIYSLEIEKLIDLGQMESKVYSKIETRISEIERHIWHLDMLLNYTFELKEKSDVKTSDGKTSDIKKPDIKKPDVKKPDVKKPDVKIKKHPKSQLFLFHG